MPDIDTNGNGPALSALSTSKALHVDDDFLSNLKGAYSTCAYFSNDNNVRRSTKKLRNRPTGYLDITIKKRFPVQQML